MQRGIVWVVDDDSSIRWVLERALTGAGLSCTTFESGSEVLDALTTKTPDVLLSDIRMPGMDGLALLKQIKQRHPMLPVIIMTAHPTWMPPLAPTSRGRLITCQNRLISTKPLPWSNAPSATIRSNSSPATRRISGLRRTSSVKRQPCRTCFASSGVCRARLSAS